MRGRPFLGLWFVVAASACGAGPGAVDSGIDGGRAVDAGLRDGGSMDGGDTDAGHSLDAGEADAGPETAIDADLPSDAALVSDAGADGGVGPDAGGEDGGADSGGSDAGAVDASPGSGDGGIDAGPSVTDAGLDAGAIAYCLDGGIVDAGISSVSASSLIADLTLAERVWLCQHWTYDVLGSPCDGYEVRCSPTSRRGWNGVEVCVRSLGRATPTCALTVADREACAMSLARDPCDDRGVAGCIFQPGC